MDDSNYDPSMDDVQPEQTGMPVWAWVLIGVCGAVVIIVIVVVVVRKRKRPRLWLHWKRTAMKISDEISLSARNLLRRKRAAPR